MSSKIRSIEKARKRKEAKNGEIIVSLGQLIGSNQESLGVLLSQELPIRQSFLLGKVAKGIGAELEQYQATNKALCERYAEKDAQGKARILDSEGNLATDGQGRYDIPEEKMEAFAKEQQELIATEVSIPGVKFKLNDLAGVKIAPAHVLALEWLLDEV